MQLSLKKPGSTEAGYLARVLTEQRARAILAQGRFASPSEVETVLLWLLSYIAEPQDRREARRILLTLSEDELTTVIEQINTLGRTQPPTE